MRREDCKGKVNGLQMAVWFDLVGKKVWCFMEETESVYRTIACNVREERRRLYLSQAQLAERADVSLDTVKSIESGRRSMSLDTYLRVVRALGTTPGALLGAGPPQEFTERLVLMAKGRSENEIQFILHVVEQALKAKDLYMRDK